MDQQPKQNKRIRKGDKVIVTTGNFRGQTGTVLSRTADKVLVQGINIRKKHVKRSEANPKGGVVELEKPIDASNVMACSQDEKPVRLKIRQTKNGERELIYNHDGKDVLYRNIKQSKI